MAQPIWITPAGSLGVIPEGVFYQQPMLATVAPLPITVTVTASYSETNLFTCNSTDQIYKGLNVKFTGTTFGGVNEYTAYFILSIPDSTHFSITSFNPYEVASPVITLTDGTGNMGTEIRQNIEYFVLSGSLPPGIQCNYNGVVAGVPQAVASFQGVPFEVSVDVTSKFTLRALTEELVNGVLVTRIRDRTFLLTVTGNDPPAWITPAGEIGTYYDGGEVNFQFAYTDTDPADAVEISLVAGELPSGITLSRTGLLYGYIEPIVPISDNSGYDLSPSGTDPYDFVSAYVSRNYQFSLEIGDGKSKDLRTFTMFVYARNEMTADTTQITADNTVVTADETTTRAPFLTNALPSDLGSIRSDNYYVYQFLGEDYDTTSIAYAISVNQGSGLPPFQNSKTDTSTTNCGLDPETGFLYGYIPDQGTTEIEYSFNITVYQTAGVSPPIECTATAAGTNRITCTSTASLAVPSDWYSPGDTPLYVPIKLSGTGLGGLSTVGETLYYVLYVYSNTEFSVTASATSTAPVMLTTAAGSMTADVVITSQPYPFTLTIVGAIDSEITWMSPENLGTLINGETSLLYVEAVNRGGRTLQYRLASGEYNSLPQGLELLPTGEIAGRVTFNTFAIDLGATIFDNKTTNWDSSYVFNVNAYAPETQQILYDVASVSVVATGSGYSAVNPPTIVFSTPVGASAETAMVGNVTIGYTDAITSVRRVANLAYITANNNLAPGDVANVNCSINSFDNSTATVLASSATQFVYSNAGADIASTIATGTVKYGTGITAVEVSNNGAGYTDVATIVITEGYGGAGANLQAVMQQTGTRDVVSVFKTFTITVSREYNAPYQSLYVQAMPPQSDRALVASLLSNQNIFIPDYIYRPTDPNFGLSTQVVYQHAFGLAPDALDIYTESLYLNHYWKNLTLGQVKTAVARDANDNIVYEVIYSQIVDNLVNADGQSVAKIEATAYPIVDPADGSSVLNVVYPNSLINMRDQVIDTVGQISTGLPLWMTSKQDNGRVLGFTPAWVIAYVKPGRGAQVAYYLDQQFGVQLNRVDFKVDRYILDRSLSLNWDSATQDWTPQPSLTTFDRFDTSGYEFVGNVTFATNLAYSDVNERTVSYINSLGGIDGFINTGQPVVSGDTLIFVKQEDFNGPPGSSYSTTDQAWQEYVVTYDEEAFDQTGTEFDQSYTVSGGDVLVCTSTNAVNNSITYTNVSGTPAVYPGLPLELFTPIGGLDSGLHVVLSAPTNTTFTVAKATTVTSVEVSTDLITVADITGFAVNDPVQFYQTTFGGLVAGVTYYILTTTAITGGYQITVSLTPGGIRETLIAGSGSCLMYGSTVAVTTDAGTMDAETFNERMAVYKINIDPASTVISLTLVDQTAANEYVQISQGVEYRSAQLYRPAAPAPELTRVSWLPLVTVVTDETTFDQDSMQFIEPVDMYDPGQVNDKYLVFPKSNILV